MATTLASPGPLQQLDGRHASGPVQDQGSCGLSPQQWAFLNSFSTVVHPKLTQLLHLLGAEQVSKSWALAQVWHYLPVVLEGRQLLKADPLCLLGSPQLRAMHTSCHEEGAPVALLGPMSKAWEHGVVKVVQSLEDLSRETHPCNRLTVGLEDYVAEVVYIPIFDLGPCSDSGVVAVLEVLVSSQAHDAQVLANTISCASRAMGALQLSLSNPLSPPHPSSPPSTAGPPKSQQQAQQQQQQPSPLERTSFDETSATRVALGALSLVGPPSATAPSAAAQLASASPSSPSSPCNGSGLHLVPTPRVSPASASPFAPARSPLDSPTKPPRVPLPPTHPPLPRPSPSSADSMAPGRAAATSLGRSSAPPSLAALPHAWPGAEAAPAVQQGAMHRSGSSSGGVGSSSGGGMGRRSLSISRTSSFRAALCDVLSQGDTAME